MNRLLKGTTVTVNGTTYKLLFDFDAVEQAEELTGKSLVMGLNGLTMHELDQPSIALVCKMFFAAAKAHEPSLTYEFAKHQIRAEIGDANGVDAATKLMNIWALVVAAWFESMPKPEETSEEAAANPTPDQS